MLPIARRHLVAKKRPKTTCNDVPFVSVGDDTLGDDASRRARDGDRPHAEGEETGNGTTDGAGNDGRSHDIDDALVSVLNSGGPCPYLHNPELVSRSAASASGMSAPNRRASRLRCIDLASMNQAHYHGRF